MAVDHDRDELLARVSIAEILEELVGPARRKQWRCPNPHHPQTGRTPPVSIDEVLGLWCCHGCDAAGSAVDAVVLARGISVAQAFTFLRARAGLDRRPRRVASAGAAAATTPSEPEVLLDRFVSARGWRADVATRFGLHVVADGPRCPRVRFPFRRAGKVVWHQDRAIGEGEPKYLSPAGKAQQPYALDLAGAMETAHCAGEVWLVEGLPDVVALAHLADRDAVPAVIGLPGVQYGGLAQLARALSGLVVVVVADSDPPGEMLRGKAAQILRSAGAEVVQVRLPPGVSDIDDLRRSVGCDDVSFEHAVLSARHGPAWPELVGEEV